MYNKENDTKVVIMDKKLISTRLKTLRESAKLSQKKLADEMGIKQPLIAKYETEIVLPSLAVLIKYGDYFDVSIDYILGRTDNPQGKLYSYNPKTFENDERMQEFIEMCFDPNSSANAKLKQAILNLLGEENNN